MKRDRVDPLRHDLRDAVSIKVISQRAGLGASAISNWRARYDDFPTPVYDDGYTCRIYLWWEVHAWMESRGKACVWDDCRLGKCGCRDEGCEFSSEPVREELHGGAVKGGKTAGHTRTGFAPGTFR